MDVVGCFLALVVAGFLSSATPNRKELRQSQRLFSAQPGSMCPRLIRKLGVGPEGIQHWACCSVDMSNPSSWRGVMSEWTSGKACRETHRAASRLRSTVGYSSAPTPAAAVPFKGKKPCKPIMAVNRIEPKLVLLEICNIPVRTPHAGCHNSSWSRKELPLRQMPEFRG